MTWIKETEGSEKILKKRLKKEGLLDRRRGKRKYGIAKNGSVRGYRFEIAEKSTPQVREDAITFFREAIQKLEEMGRYDPYASKTQS